MRLGMRAFGVALVAMSVVGASAASARSGHVYIMRGFTGMFSTGMDELGAELRTRGVDASVHSYAAYGDLATEAAATYRKDHAPIIIIGHSMGADSAVSMADELKQARVPVALVVTFSPSDVEPAPANVAQVVNYYQAGSIWRGRITAAPGFHGRIRNVNLDGDASINHLNIDDAARLHKETIAKILAITGTRRHVPGTAAALPAKTSTTE